MATEAAGSHAVPAQVLFLYGTFSFDGECTFHKDLFFSLVYAHGVEEVL